MKNTINQGQRDRWTALQQKFSPQLLKVIRNAGWLVAYQILYMGMGLFVNVWLARYLGPEQFGLYSYVLAFIALFSTFLSLGLEGIVVRDMVREPEHQPEILGTTFVIRFLGGCLSFGLALAGITLLRPNDHLIRLLVAILGLGMVFRVFDVIDFWFQSQVKAGQTVVAKSAALILGLLAKLLLIMMGAPLIAFITVTAIEVIAGGIGLVFAYRTSGKSLKTWRVSFKRVQNLLSQSWPLILSGVAAAINLKVDQVMLGEMVGNAEVGIYAAAARLSEVWYFIPTAIAASTFPALIRSKDTSEAVYYSRLQQLYTGLAAIALVVAVVATFVAKPGIMLLYGSAYAKAGTILAIHIWASLFVFMREARAKWIITEGLFKFGLICHGLGAVMNLVINWFLIPRYGGIGAAIATVVSYTTASYLANFLYPKTRIAGIMMTIALLTPFRLGYKALRQARAN